MTTGAQIRSDLLESFKAVVVYYWRDYWSFFLFLLFALGMFVVAVLLARAGLEL